MRAGAQVGAQAGGWVSNQEGGREGETMVAKCGFLFTLRFPLFGAVLPSLMTGRCTTCSRLVSTVPRGVGRPPKRKKKSGKTGVTSTEIPSPPPPPRPRLTPTFRSPVLSTVEEHPPTSVGIPPMEADTDVAENVLLTLCSPAPRHKLKGGKETQHRHSDVPEVGSSSATGSSLPSRHLQDGKYSVSEDEADGSGGGSDDEGK